MRGNFPAWRLPRRFLFGGYYRFCGCCDVRYVHGGTAELRIEGERESQWQETNQLYYQKAYIISGSNQRTVQGFLHSFPEISSLIQAGTVNARRHIVLDMGTEIHEILPDDVQYPGFNGYPMVVNLSCFLAVIIKVCLVVRIGHSLMPQPYHRRCNSHDAR